MPGQVYLVGGAVRDQLLGLDVVERDWVVVGSTPDEMKQAGYRQVGASFPVFIHPHSGDEYALARTERKQGHGYHGFSVDFHPGVTLEEDLLRRDLTINAIARDDRGQIIDPFGGQADLESRCLRHVSNAFAEDPLRVLRVARFAARFHSLGFQVHPSTADLMTGIVKSGEMEHLVPERIWAELIRAMGEARPSEFLRVMRKCGALQTLFPEIEALFGVPQVAEYHPEIDTGEHLMMALDMAVAIDSPAESVFAVLLHDLGKAVTPRNQWPRHPGHEAAGVPLVEAVCERLRVPTSALRLARRVCAEHLNCHRVREMRPAKVFALLERLDALRQPQRLAAFLKACEADYRGRLGLQDRGYPQADHLSGALQAALAVRVADLDVKGLAGKVIGEKLRLARIAAIREQTVQPAE
jgi:tRNA nucleotidyltransferase (CCA-adding enzyme)